MKNIFHDGAYRLDINRRASGKLHAAMMCLVRSAVLQFPKRLTVHCPTHNAQQMAEVMNTSEIVVSCAGDILEGVMRFGTGKDYTTMRFSLEVL